MRDAAPAIIREVGGPRPAGRTSSSPSSPRNRRMIVSSESGVSRSSAACVQGTGFPIANIAALWPWNVAGPNSELIFEKKASCFEPTTIMWW